MNKLIVLLFVALCSDVVGQVRYGALGLSAGSSQAAVNLSYHDGWQIGNQKKLELGIGVRITGFFGYNQYLTTAPSKLTKGSSGPGSLFKPDIPANIDSLFVQAPQVTMMNLMLTINYRWSNRWQTGFNIDALGFSFGSQQSATFIHDDQKQVISASPTTFNLLLIGDNDKGSLNSELYVRYALPPKLAFQFGIQHLFTEYTTSLPVQTSPESNDRFRLKSNLISVGLLYYLN